MPELVPELVLAKKNKRSQKISQIKKEAKLIKLQQKNNMMIIHSYDYCYLLLVAVLENL